MLFVLVSSFSGSSENLSVVPLAGILEFTGQAIKAVGKAVPLM